MVSLINLTVIVGNRLVVRPKRIRLVASAVGIVLTIVARFIIIRGPSLLLLLKASVSGSRGVSMSAGISLLSVLIIVHGGEVCVDDVAFLRRLDITS